MKTCSKCSISYDVSFFVKDKNRKDGLQPQCKSCDKEYRLKNKEHKSNYDSQYNQINKRKKSEYARIYIKDRLKRDNLYKLTHYTRHLIGASFKRDKGIDPNGAWTTVQKKTLAGAKSKAKLTPDKQLGATKMKKK